MASSNSDNFDFKKLLAKPLLRDPIWCDLSEACNKVLGREVEERRRRLQSSRESSKNRKGDILSQIKYLPEIGKPAIENLTGNPTSELNTGDTISKAIIKRIYNNVAKYGAASVQDYFEVEFKSPKGKTLTWLLPIDATQERELLVKNAYNLGFDFFNTELSTEDYQRLYEYLNMFWGENGLDDKFIKFIGFIKNLRLEMLPLWSLDDGTDIISILETLNNRVLPASKGGNWYLTSHVEIRYDLKLQLQGLDLKELERLFYLFAPIMLVLERIVGSIDVDMKINVANSVQLEVINYGVSGLPLNAIFIIKSISAVQLSCVNYGIYESLIDTNALLNKLHPVINSNYIKLSN